MSSEFITAWSESDHLGHTSLFFCLHNSNSIDFLCSHQNYDKVLTKNFCTRHDIFLYRTFVQALAWCRQATSQYLNECWHHQECMSHWVSVIDILSTHDTLESSHSQGMTSFYIDGLVQERCNSSVLAMELHLSYPNPLTQWLQKAYHNDKNGSKLTDDIFKMHLFKWKILHLIKISLEFAPKGSTDYKSWFIQLMTLHWTGNKQLFDGPVLWYIYSAVPL